MRLSADERLVFKSSAISFCDLFSIASIQVFQRVGLRHHSDIVLKSEDLAYAHTVDRLRIRKNNANSVGLSGSFCALGPITIILNFHSRPPPRQPRSHCSAKRYSSMVAAARCSLWLEEQRTTRPVQWTRTSCGVPRIACGMRIENFTS